MVLVINGARLARISSWWRPRAIYRCSSVCARAMPSPLRNSAHLSG